MDESFAGVVLTDAAGVIEYANRSFETTSGYGAAELIGQSIAGLSANEELDQSIWAVLNAEERWRGEIKNKRPNGEVYYLLATIQPLRSDDGEITHYIGVNIDITERVKAEEALAEREAYWRALVENAPDHILTVDKDGVIMSLNWTLPGVTVEETVGSTVYDFVREEYHDAWREALAGVFGGGQRAEFEVRTIGGPLEAQWYANTLSAVYDGDTVIAAIVSSRDVTARKRAEEELAEREAFWRALVENVPDLILAVDEDGVIKSLNWIVRGATVDEAVGPTVYDFVREEYHDAWREALVKVFAGVRRVEIEARTIGGDGDSQWYANMLGPVYDGDTVVAAIISSRNVTARKKAEEELAEREAYWRALVENAPDHILIVDEDGVITSLNRSVPGTAVDDVVGRTVYDFVREEYRDVWREALEEVFGGGPRVEFEVRTFDIPGKTQSYAITLSAVCEGDTVAAAIASILNITLLKEAEERMRAIATAVSDIVVVVDEDGFFLDVLAPTTEIGLLQLPPEEIRGRRVHEFLPHDQADRALELVRQTVSTGRPGEGELLLDLPRGVTWVFARSAPLSLGDGRVVAVIHVLDISERKRLEEELQRVREETEAEAEEGVKRASEYGLTFREITVLSLIARGKSDKEIAMLLGLSRYTVNKHSSNLVRKLGSRSRSQAAALAVRESII
jgi:PAS domain S-box-containing protein